MYKIKIAEYENSIEDHPHRFDISKFAAKSTEKPLWKKSKQLFDAGSLSVNSPQTAVTKRIRVSAASSWSNTS